MDRGGGRRSLRGSWISFAPTVRLHRKSRQCLPLQKRLKKPAAPRKKAAPKAPSLEEILLAKPKGVADDLKAISGVGPKLETALNEAGIFHYWQIASLTDEQIEALDKKLDFRGRMARDNWISQARGLSETVS